MANTETSVSNLKINRLTQTQLENASSLSNSELYMVDPEFTGGKVLATDSNGDIVETTVAPADIGTVKTVNNTSPDSNGNVSLTIPSEVTETTVSNWGFTKNTGTVTSVNNVSPVSGNVTIPVGDTLPSQTGNASKVLGTNGATTSWVEQYSRNIGEIVASTIPLTDAGLHLLDGSLLQYGSYQAFIDYIADLVTDYPDLFTTEANWQTSVTNYGSCDKFVYDDVNNTVRIPKRTSEHGALIKSYSSGTDWYRIYQDGWCEQGGLFPITNSWNTNTVTFLKPFRNNNYIFFYSNGFPNNSGINGIASKSPTQAVITIYNGSDAGQGGWQASGYIDISNYQYSPIYEYLVVATSTKTDIQVDIDEIATDLNGKADIDLSNITPTQTVKNTIINWGMPDWANAIDISSSFPYTCPSDGYLYINNWNGYVEVGSDVCTVPGEYVASGTGAARNTGMFPVVKNEKLTLSGTYNNWETYFVPMKGV